MRWKWVVRAACLAPMFGGCVGVYHPRDDWAAERGANQFEREIRRTIERRAREAWQEVVRQYSRRQFTPEFRDGFLDGYTDYLDRGGDGQPPAAPPPRYTQNKHYYTPEGHVRLRDYLLGFKYGTDVAVASGQRQFLTVPVLVPVAAESIESVVTAEETPAASAPLPLAMPRAMAAPPPTAEVSAPGQNPPPEIVPTVPTIPPIPSLPSVPELPSPQSRTPATSPVKPASGGYLPPPPHEVGELPPEVPMPPNRDDAFEPLPPNFDLPPLAPQPVNHSGK